MPPYGLVVHKEARTEETNNTSRGENQEVVAGETQSGLGPRSDQQLFNTFCSMLLSRGQSSCQEADGSVPLSTVRSD